jgi:hypothetical protein
VETKLPDPPGATKSGSTIAAGGDNDIEMDGGPVKDGDMDSRGQPALPPEKVNLCQYSGLVYEKLQIVWTNTFSHCVQLARVSMQGLVVEQN